MLRNFTYTLRKKLDRNYKKSKNALSRLGIKNVCKIITFSKKKFSIVHKVKNMIKKR